MAWYITLFKAIGSFVKYSYKEPIWIVATIIFVSSVPFLSAYQFLRPDEQASLEKTIYERQVQMEDNERMNNLRDQITAEKAYLDKPSGRFISLLQDMENSLKQNKSDSLIMDTNDPRLANYKQEFEEIYALAVAGRKKVELTLAKIKGTYFRMDIFNKEIKILETTMGLEITIMKLIEDVCAAFLRGNVVEFNQQIQDGVRRYTTLIEEEVTATAQWQSMKMELDSIFRLKLIEYNIAVAQARRHRYMEYLKLPALVFSIGYVIAFGWSVKKYSKGIRRGILRQQQKAFRPKKRNKR